MQSKAAGLYNGTVVKRSGPADNILGGSENRNSKNFMIMKFRHRRRLLTDAIHSFSLEKSSKLF